MPFTKELLEILEQGLGFYKISPSKLQLEKFYGLLLAMQRWNKTYNLTAITDLKQMVIKHIFDSLSLLPFLPEQGRILDVGTGAGFPGLPLSIIREDLELVLLDSNSKKISFINFITAKLEITNVTAEASRVESYNASTKFKWIVSRAFSDLVTFVSGAQRLCHKDGFFIAMKGNLEKTETEPLPEGSILTKIERVKVPFLQEERCLVFICKQ